VPFGGKYRIIDFVSATAPTRGSKQLRSADAARADLAAHHIGSGRAWDLARRRACVLIQQPTRRVSERLVPRHGRRQSRSKLEPDRRAQSERVLVLSGDHV